MIRGFLCALGLMMSGCLYINSGQAKSVAPNQYSVSCIVDEAYCFDIARDTCRGDFVVVSRNQMQLLINCKQSR